MMSINRLDMEMKNTDSPWLSWIAFAASIWLIAAPGILGYSVVARAASNDVIIGILLSIISFIAAVSSGRVASWVSWLAAIGGLWQMSSPFVLNYTDSLSPLANSLILGLIIVVASVSRALRSQSFAPREFENRQYGPAYFSEERPETKENKKREITPKNPKFTKPS